MKKTIKNRIGNALVISFMASIGWGIVAYLNDGLMTGIGLFCAMYLPIFILMIILVYMKPELDLFNKTPEVNK